MFHVNIIFRVTKELLGPTSPPRGRWCTRWGTSGTWCGRRGAPSSWWWPDSRRTTRWGVTTPPLSCLLSPLSCLLSPVSCLLSPVSSLLSPLSSLLSPLSSSFSFIFHLCSLHIQSAELVLEFICFLKFIMKCERFLFGRQRACVLVTFRHKHHLVWVRERSCFLAYFTKICRHKHNWKMSNVSLKCAV